MNKRDLARVFIRVVGVYMVASAVSGCVASLVTAWWVFGANEPKFHSPMEMAVQCIVQTFLQGAIGLFLFYRGGLVAKKLLRLDETMDV